jgi:hypothetical protein
MSTKGRRYLGIGLLVDLALLAATVVAIVLGSVLTYDGRCGSIIMEPTHTSCSLLQYVGTELFIIVIVGTFVFWWAILVILLLPPLIGYLSGRRIPAAKIGNPTW